MKDKEIYIKVTKDGPYIVYGISSIESQEILTDKNGICIKYGNKKSFNAKTEPTALCRCGKSQNAPFCDGNHIKIQFNGKETASFEPILKNATKYEGINLTLMDNEKFCAFARFCDANGSIWNLINVGNEVADADAIREARLCPSGRLILFDKNGNPLDSALSQSVSVLEDTGLKISGPIWVKGGIRVESEDGKSYEIRNKQTLCRCGQSKNKPFCDSTHMHIKFRAKNN